MKKSQQYLGVFLASVLLISGCTGGTVSTSSSANSVTQTKVQIMGPWVVESPEDKILGGVVELSRKAHTQVAGKSC